MGRVAPPKRMKFRKSSKLGVIFSPKIFVADFGPIDRAFWALNEKKMQHDFPKMRGEGERVKGLLELLWNSSVLVTPPIPYLTFHAFPSFYCLSFTCHNRPCPDIAVVKNPQRSWEAQSVSGESFKTTFVLSQGWTNLNILQKSYKHATQSVDTSNCKTLGNENSKIRVFSRSGLEKWHS